MDSRGNRSGRAAGAALGQLEPFERLRQTALVLEVVVEVVDLPLHAARILHPELILVGVAAVDTHLLAHGYARRFHTLKLDRKSTRLNSSHGYISYAVFCLKKKKK